MQAYIVEFFFIANIFPVKYLLLITKYHRTHESLDIFCIS